MATGVAFAEADVTSPDGTVYEGVSISTRNNTLVVRTPEGDTLVSAPGVTAVVRQSRKRWLVRFGPAGDTWTVLRTKCSCGS